MISPVFVTQAPMNLLFKLTLYLPNVIPTPYLAGVALKELSLETLAFIFQVRSL